MSDKFNNLDNDNLLIFIRENIHWIYSRQKHLFDSINSQYSNKNWISKKQRNVLIKVAIKLNERKSKRFLFKEYRRDFYKNHNSI